MMMKVVQNQTMTEREKFSKLVRESHAELLVYARSLTREDTNSRDIVQDSFVVAWSNMNKFEVTRDFGSWMRGIIRNKWREYLRKNNRQVAMDDDVLESIEMEMRQWQSIRDDGGPTVFIKLEQCMSRLPETLMQAVKCFYYDGHSTDEAAEKLSIGGATLRKRLQRARVSLKDCIKITNN